MATEAQLAVSSSASARTVPLRVLQFARLINRFDFIDVVLRHADPMRFAISACTLRAQSNIAPTDYASDGIPHYVLAERSRLSHPLLAIRLSRLLGELQVDVLHTHHYDEALIGWLATRIRPRTRLVLGRHYSDSLHVLPSVSKRRVLLALEGVANRGARRIVVPSSYVRDIITQRQGVPAGKVDLIPYGVDPAKYPTLGPSEVAGLRAELGVADRFALGTFGRLDHQKGHRYLIEALASLRTSWPKLHLFVVGEGPTRSALEEQTRAAGLGACVRFLGWRRDAPRLMSAMDAVVQPTLQEAFSQVMVEALWMERPLVITEVGGVVDVIRPGENGLVVARGDSRSLADAVARLVSDGELCRRLGAAGRVSVAAALAAPVIVRRYERTYLEAAGLSPDPHRGRQ